MEIYNDKEMEETEPLQYKRRRYSIGDLWWNSPEKIHVLLSELRMNLPPVLVIEKVIVLMSKKIAELKSEYKVANLLFVTLDFIVQNILQQPRDCIINYSTSIGLKKFNKDISETKDVWFIHFTPDDMISKPKEVILQIKAMRSCAKSLLKMIDLVEDGTLLAPQYLLGITNLEMANFAQKYGFEIAEDLPRAKINQRIFRSRNIVTKVIHKESLKIHDATLNSVVYLKFEDLLATEFRAKLAKTIKRSDLLHGKLITKNNKLQ